METTLAAKKVTPATFFFMVCIAASLAWSNEIASGPLPDEAIRMLMEGNDRFMTGNALHPNADTTRRRLTAANGQKPYAAILSCADSRVPLEVLFDAGVGDLFCSRVAGNIANVDEIGTLEYGTEHLGIPLILVLGHTKCGAVTAAVHKAHVEGSISAILDNIAPAVEKVRAKNPKAEATALVSDVITANIWQAMEDILVRSRIIREMVVDGKIKMVGALYNIETGKVIWMGGHPEVIKILVNLKLEEMKSEEPKKESSHKTVQPAKLPSKKEPGHSGSSH